MATGYGDGNHDHEHIISHGLSMDLEQREGCSLQGDGCYGGIACAALPLGTSI